MAFTIIKFLPLITTVVKGFISNAKQDYKIRTFDKTREKIDTIEHMMIKHEKKLNEMRNEIEDLRKKIVFAQLMNLILSILIIYLVIFMR